jgi:DNA-binding Lrp family transcriptional regulator
MSSHKNSSPPPAQLSACERRLLNDYQQHFPLSPAPFDEIAADLGTSPEPMLAQLRALLDAGAVSRVGPVIAPHSIGASCLAALSAPERSLDAIAELVNSYPEVNHNYEREHRFNLWFVVTTDNEQRLEAVLDEIERRAGTPVMRLPMLEAYHIDLGFELS